MTESVSRNMFSVYITSVVPAGLTYIFWLIVANQTSPEIIGIVVALGSFSMVLSSFAGFEISIGMKRFLGIAYAEKKHSEFKQIVFVSSLFVIISSLLILVIALNPFFNILDLVGIDSKFTPIIITIVIGNGLVNIFVNALISSLRSDSLVIPYLVSSFGRFPVLFGLFYLFEKSEMSVAWAYSSHYLILAVIMMIVTVTFLRKGKESIFTNFSKHLKIILEGSLPKYIPQLVASLQTQFSILTIFAMKGPIETGVYYISFAIFAIISMIPSAINGVSHPVMSGMDETSQAVFLRRTLKIGFILTMPIAAIATFYSEPILSIFGDDFTVSTEIVLILLVSLPMAIIMDGCYYYLYARGDYKKILYLGFTINISRIIFYFILVPEFGGIGAAISYVIGSILQLGLTLFLVKNAKINLEIKKYMIISSIPFGIAIVVDYLQIEIISAILIVILSFIVYARLRLFNEEDLESGLRIILPNNKVEPTKIKIITYLKKMYLM
jgi:O-antigen/teichoic acid export membrane protein